MYPGPPKSTCNYSLVPLTTRAQPLARRHSAEHRVHVAIDEAGRHRGAPGVHRFGGTGCIDRRRLADLDDAAVDRDDGVGLEDRLHEIAREQRPDVPDDQLLAHRDTPLTIQTLTSS